MYYNLIIFDRNPWIYLDMVEMIQTMLRYKEIGSQICILWQFEDIAKFDMKDGESKNIYFGHDIYDLYIKPGSILTEFDPAGFTSFPKYTIDQVENITMSCYSKHSSKEFTDLFPMGKVVPFKYGYMESYDFQEQIERDIDICFITNPMITNRRSHITDALKIKGYNVFVNDIYLLPKERSEFYKRSKIIISIYGEDTNLKYSSGSRIYPAASMKGNFVIAEKCDDPEQHQILSDICINVPYDDLIDTIEYFLKYPEIRNKLATKFYKNIRNTYADFGLDP